MFFIVLIRKWFFDFYRKVNEVKIWKCFLEIIVRRFREFVIFIVGFSGWYYDGK